MRDRPDTADLLKIARQVLRNDLTDLLPTEKRYQALMVSNAIAIAGRQLGVGGETERRELVVLRDLLGVDGQSEDLYRELSARIRDGTYAAGTPDHARARAFLETITRRRVSESNPRALDQD